MANIRMLQQQVAGVTKEIADLGKKIADQKQAAAAQRKVASRKTDSARRASSATTAQRYAKEAARYEDKAIALDRKVASLESDLARARKKLATKQSALNSAEQSQARADQRDTTRRRREELAHARRIAQAQRSAVVRTIPPRAVPTMLEVAYFTASPTGEKRLQVDREVREVGEAVRKALHRDLLNIRPWPAATFDDLDTALNEQAPQLVHFAGHGSEQGLFFDGTDGFAPDGIDVDYALLARVLRANDNRPRVVVLNACDSFAGVEHLLEAVEVVVAMTEEISDAGARMFAVKFYGAIASGQSLGSAFEQGCNALDFMTNEGHLPEMVARDEEAAAALKLVQPIQQQAS